MNHEKILIPVTNHATLGDTDQANGTYAPELTHALKEIMAAGYEYDIASINGGKAPLYGTDIEGIQLTLISWRMMISKTALTTRFQ